MIMHWGAKAGLFHGKHAMDMDHSKLAMEIHDLIKDSIVTSITLLGFFALFCELNSRILTFFTSHCAQKPVNATN